MKQSRGAEGLCLLCRAFRESLARMVVVGRGPEDEQVNCACSGGKNIQGKRDSKYTGPQAGAII